MQKRGEWLFVRWKADGSFQLSRCTMEFVQYFGCNATTALTDDNLWWKGIEKASMEMYATYG